MEKPSIEYFNVQYRLSYLDWLTASTECCRDEALDHMARVFNTVSVLYGIDEADKMKSRCS